ncbi:hypothetical protein RM780_15090 [Streptomyces sp. DSM 44917]|uniref:ATP-binding protein n=1 Tax=Streptomyces boetiae TaxID=3075541 RepID=A0ABU2L9V3_9ACTN|nr:hypothetical protein [Streptomyces sp. DSM 44917]MDT0308277.1 hypothetical protein [Streptomyces sp. DSM 44917]
MGADEIVRRLYFGRDDAESDLAEGLLRDGFLPTAAWDAVMSGRKMLVIGRKGTGKSAICMRLTIDADLPGGTALITPDDAAGEEIRRFELQGLTGESAKALIWRYVFAVHAARHVIAHARRGMLGRLPASVRALRTFLRQNGEEGEARLYDRLAGGARSLQTSLSLEAFGVRAGLDLAGTSEGARAAGQLEVLEAGVAAALRDLDWAKAHGPLLILVDQLEQVWSDDPDSMAMVTGLLLAGKHLPGAYGGVVRCVLFLRADIYDALEFSDGDKYRGDEIRIAWSAEQLRRLALTRASVSLGEELTEDRLWGEIFPAALPVGPTADYPVGPTADYLFAQCLPRPRDAIQFLNLCRDRAAECGAARIGPAHILEATRQFSEWKLQDIAREYAVSFPYLARVLAMFQGSGYVVTRAEVAERFGTYREALHERFPAYTDALTPERIVDLLFGVHFLGVRRGASVLYAADAQVPAQPHEQEFHIHPCFRPALNATTPAVATEVVIPTVHNLIAGYSNVGTVVQAGTISGDISFGPSREVGLARSLAAAVRRLTAQLERGSFPPELAAHVDDELSQAMAMADSLLLDVYGGRSRGAAAKVATVANFLDALAAALPDGERHRPRGRPRRLTDGGPDPAASEPDAEPDEATRAFARALRTEARALRRELGGGPGGNSGG